MNNKDILLLLVKYIPALLAISCSVKIWLSSYLDHVSLFVRVFNWINVALYAIITYLIYVEGRWLGLCWKHKSLCRMAFWGYLYYSTFIIFSVDSDIVRALAITFIVIVIVTTILYNFIK